MKRPAVLSLMILLCSCLPALALQVPQYHGYVNDFADMISPGTEQQLEETLQAFDQTDSTQVAVLTIESLEGDSLEEFSIRVVDDWKIGQRGRDNGVLLLIAEKERKVRIEVGRGLEGVLTDLAAGRIIDHVITPPFKGGRFDEGVATGIDAIVKTTRGEFSGTGERQGRWNGDANSFISYLVMSFFVLVMLSHISRLLVSAAGALALPLSVFLGLPVPFSPITLLFLAAIGGLGGFMLHSMLAEAGKKSRRRGRSAVHRRGGRMYAGSGFSGSGGGFSGGFGGFGGGGFGGGGASGRW